MSMLKDIFEYVRKYGVIRLMLKIPGRIYRTFKPILNTVGLFNNGSIQANTLVSCFTPPHIVPRLNLVMTGQENGQLNTDRIIHLLISLADRTGYDLRIISGEPFNTLRFSRVLKASGIKTGNVEFVSFATTRPNTELDIGPLDIFIVSTPAAADRIVDYVNTGNIFDIKADQTANPGILDDLLQKVTRVITRHPSGAPHVCP